MKKIKKSDKKLYLEVEISFYLYFNIYKGNNMLKKMASSSLRSPDGVDTKNNKKERPTANHKSGANPSTCHCVASHF